MSQAESGVPAAVPAAAPPPRRERRVGLSGWIAIALVAGVAVGLFFGELTAPLQVVADAFVRLLQMAVLPYVTASLIHGLGSLSYRDAGFVARFGGVALLLTWAVTLLAVLATPLAFPSVQSATPFSSSLVEPRPALDFVSLYIPANPFRSLSENAVPAVVLFCIATGIALIGIEPKAALLESLSVLTKALGRVTGFVVKLTPVGVFAIAASAAGSMSIQEFGRIQVHLFSYVVAGAVLAFWLLPGLVSALTPITFRDVLRVSRDALVTAFSTGSVFVVLPMIGDNVKQLLGSEREDSDAIVDVLVPVSFNFPGAGKLFVIAFVLFAGWYTGAEITGGQLPALVGAGMLTLFGSINVAVPFLLDLFRIPADSFQLFIAMGVITARLATLLAAMNLVVLTVLAAAAIQGRMRFAWMSFLRYLGVGVALLLLSLLGTRVLLGGMLDPDYRAHESILRRGLLGEPAPFSVLEPDPAPPVARRVEGTRVDRIRETGVLRVGIDPARDSIPFVYRNEAGELVGFDVEMAHRLAADLGVRLAFVPHSITELEAYLEADRFDIAMTGLALAVDRSLRVAFSEPYMDLTLGFVVPDHRRDEFATRKGIRELGPVRIGMGPSVYYRTQVLRQYPEAEVVDTLHIDAILDPEQGLDAVGGAAEAMAAWTLLNPAFSVAVPQPDPFRAPAAYAMPRDDQPLVNLVSDWIRLKKADGTIDALYRYWILGQSDALRQPRWSVVRDVLGWVE